MKCIKEVYNLHGYHSTLPFRRIILGIVMTTMFLAGQMCLAAPNTAKAEPTIVTKCRQDLSKKLNVSLDTVTLKKADAVQWPDTSLGMAQPGMMYTQVITPGFKVVLQARREDYIYHTSSTAVRYVGAASLMDISLLSVEPQMTDANLNGDLYQVSLFGGRRVKLASGVSECYPQQNGLIAFKTRTSRSGFELSYIDARKPALIKPLSGAFDFADVSINAKQDRWAGFVRPNLGGTWLVMVAPVIKGKSEPVKIELPEGTKPYRIAWKADQLRIIVNAGEMSRCYAADLSQNPVAWKFVDMEDFPGFVTMVLNKSQNLDVRDTVDDGRPAVEVSNLWFTGTRDLVAMLPDLKLGSCDMMSYRYLWVNGRNGDKPVACVVDIGTGLTTRYEGRVGSSLKLFYWPLPQAKAVKPK